MTPDLTRSCTATRIQLRRSPSKQCPDQGSCVELAPKEP